MPKVDLTTSANSEAKSEGSAESRALTPSEGPISLESAVFADVAVEIEAYLGPGTVTVRDLLDLKPGGVVPLGTALNGPVELRIDRHVIAHGEIVAVGDQFGVRVTEIFAQR